MMEENSDKKTGLGVDGLPENIRRSTLFSAVDLQALAAESAIPVIDPSYYDERLKNIFQYYSINPEEMEKELQLYAKELLSNGKVREAWQVLRTME